jgi:hypothetical protein
MAAAQSKFGRRSVLGEIAWLKQLSAISGTSAE